MFGYNLDILELQEKLEGSTNETKLNEEMADKLQKGELAKTNSIKKKVQHRSV